MFGLWVPVTVAAAGLQSLRTAQQKHLTGVIGQSGAHFARYFYGAPLAALLVGGMAFGGVELPRADAGFFLFGLAGGLMQIVATGCLIHAYTLRNFTAATTFSKTETIQAAVLSTLFMGEGLSGGGWVAVAVGFVGLVALAVGRQADGWRKLGTAWREPATVYGLASGLFFALCSMAIRSAALRLPAADPFIAAAVTLCAITAMQTVVMGLFLLVFDRAALAGALNRAWRPASTVGILSVVGSLGWFFAMTLEPVAHVRALAQVEIVFTILLTVFVFRERPSRLEYAGAGLIVGSVVILLLAR
ncbi:DMT family transporter [Zavarzinia sp.]|uniref:DMT family transporter n=1 Tax=Zavarzinia sp. TaxID=2027920 RepID=UPI00356A27E3